MTEPAVAFLRAVNVGGRNTVPQAALSAALAERLGTPVRHLLQSGNLAVAATEDPAALAAAVHALIAEQTGQDIAVIVRTAKQLSALVARNPWLDEDPTRVHLSMWDAAHEPSAEAGMMTAEWGGDEIRFAGTNAWMRYATSFHEAKLGNQVVERRLKVIATARNAQTVRSALDLARSLGEALAAADDPVFDLPRFNIPKPE